MPSFEQLMRKREGVKTKVYLDSLKKPTVGIGHLVTPADKLKVGDVITDKQVSDFFKVDGAKAMAAAKSQAAKAGIKDGQFVVYLASVNFQLGTGWTRKFKNTWQMIMDGKYSDAAKALDGTNWAKQTPVRVKDFKKALLDLPEKKDSKAA
jgi:lysozyme